MYTLVYLHWGITNELSCLRVVLLKHSCFCTFISAVTCMWAMDITSRTASCNLTLLCTHSANDNAAIAVHNWYMNSCNSSSPFPCFIMLLYYTKYNTTWLISIYPPLSKKNQYWIDAGGGKIAQSLTSLSTKQVVRVRARLDALVLEGWNSITVLLTRSHQCRRLVQKRRSICYHVCVIMCVKDP